MNLINPYFDLYQSLSSCSNSFQVTAASIRKNLIWAYSWAIPSSEAILKLVEHAPLLEMGAGTGYWAWLCQQAGAQIIAFDRNAAGAPHWMHVEHGDASTVSLLPERTLFLCWPPLNESFAADCLAAYRGQYLLYVGEHRGRTADSTFHDDLESNFNLQSTVAIPCWPGYSDQLFVYRRKGV